MEKDLLGMDNFNMYNIIEDTYSHFPSCVICLLEKKIQIIFSGCIFGNEIKNKFCFHRQKYSDILLSEYSNLTMLRQKHGVIFKLF